MIHTASINRFLPTLPVVGGRREPTVLLRAGFNSRLFSVLKQSFFCMSLWITMPLAIWLSSGWVGLFIVLQALLGAATLHNIATPNSGLRTARVSSLAGQQIFEGEVSCALIKSETN
jgi:hypothetical protein